MNIVSLRTNPALLEQFIQFFSEHWFNEAVYRDCMTASLTSDVIGGCGLISNDFNARQDLTPYLAGLYIEEPHRGRAYGGILLEHVRRQCTLLGFRTVYLTTDHTGYYEHYGFHFIGTTSDPFGETGRLYEAAAICGCAELLACAKRAFYPIQQPDVVPFERTAAAILTDRGNVYSGTGIDAGDPIGVCAGRNAAAAMLAHGETRAVLFASVKESGEILHPSQLCRSLLLQINPANAAMKIVSENEEP